MWPTKENLKYLTEHQINVILVFSEKITFNVSDPKVQNIFFNAVQPVRLNN